MGARGAFHQHIFKRTIRKVQGNFGRPYAITVVIGIVVFTTGKYRCSQQKCHDG